MFKTYINQGTRITELGVPKWALILGGLLAGGIGILLFIVSAGLLLMLAPFAIAAVLYARWRIRRAIRKAAEQSDITIIDAEYRVIDEHRG